MLIQPLAALPGPETVDYTLLNRFTYFLKGSVALIYTAVRYEPNFQ